MDKKELSHVIFSSICSWAGWHVIDSVCKAIWSHQHEKSRMEEKGGIVRKAKVRGKIEMEITKKMKGNFQGIFFSCEINYSQLMQSLR